METTLDAPLVRERRTFSVDSGDSGTDDNWETAAFPGPDDGPVISLNRDVTVDSDIGAISMLGIGNTTRSATSPTTH